MTNIFSGSLLDPTRAKKPKVTKTFALFPDGTESEIVARQKPTSGPGDFSVSLPDGSKMSNSKLRDLKFFLEQDFPGVQFERRKGANA